MGEPGTQAGAAQLEDLQRKQAKIMAALRHQLRNDEVTTALHRLEVEEQEAMLDESESFGAAPRTRGRQGKQVAGTRTAVSANLPAAYTGELSREYDAEELEAIRMAQEKARARVRAAKKKEKAQREEEVEDHLNSMPHHHSTAHNTSSPVYTPRSWGGSSAQSTPRGPVANVHQQDGMKISPRRTKPSIPKPSPTPPKKGSDSFWAAPRRSLSPHSAAGSETASPGQGSSTRGSDILSQSQKREPANNKKKQQPSVRPSSARSSRSAVSSTSSIKSILKKPSTPDATMQAKKQKKGSSSSTSSSSKKSSKTSSSPAGKASPAAASKTKKQQPVSSTSFDEEEYYAQNKSPDVVGTRRAQARVNKWSMSRNQEEARARRAEHEVQMRRKKARQLANDYCRQTITKPFKGTPPKSDLPKNAFVHDKTKTKAPKPKNDNFPTYLPARLDRAATSNEGTKRTLLINKQIIQNADRNLEQQRNERRANQRAKQADVDRRRIAARAAVERSAEERANRSPGAASNASNVSTPRDTHADSAASREHLSPYGAGSPGSSIYSPEKPWTSPASGTQTSEKNKPEPAGKRLKPLFTKSPLKQIITMPPPAPAEDDGDLLYDYFAEPFDIASATTSSKQAHVVKCFANLAAISVSVDRMGDFVRDLEQIRSRPLVTY